MGEIACHSTLFSVFLPQWDYPASVHTISEGVPRSSLLRIEVLPSPDCVPIGLYGFITHPKILQHLYLQVVPRLLVRNPSAGTILTADKS